MDSTLHDHYAESSQLAWEPAKMLRALTEPWPAGERTKRAIDRAAQLTGLSYWRVFDIWYGKARRIEPHEIENIKQALDAKNERERTNEQATRDELRTLKLRIARLEARLDADAADVLGPTPDLARNALCGGG
jgi:hypothetical protein